jgi:hypothetical protein
VLRKLATNHFFSFFLMLNFLYFFFFSFPSFRRSMPWP